MGDQIGRQEFCKHISVSRETLVKLDEYAALLQKWSPTINLVSRSTLPNLWTRHFLDSAQVFNHRRADAGLWVDIGSGGGFPGMVCAVLALEKAPDLKFTFAESDLRKSVFLQTVIRSLSLNASTIPRRAEEIEPLGADILSARALAPLPVLLGYAERHLKPDGQALFMQGASFRREQDESLDIWQYQSDEYHSITDGAAVILSLGDIRRV